MFPPNFLLVYIYYYTEWLSLRRVHGPKSFTSIYLLLYRVIELALRSSPNLFFFGIYIYSVLQNHRFRVEFFAQIFLLVYMCYFQNKIMFLLSKVVRANLFIQYCLTFSRNSHNCIYRLNFPRESSFLL